MGLGPLEMFLLKIGLELNPPRRRAPPFQGGEIMTVHLYRGILTRPQRLKHLGWMIGGFGYVLPMFLDPAVWANPYG